MQPHIYGFSGKMGTGKDFLAGCMMKMLPKDYKCISLSLADHFKVDAIVKLGMNYEKVYGHKDEETRVGLQLMGTEEGRNKYGMDIWVNVLKTWFKIHSGRGIQCFFITDIRFPNEIESLKLMSKEGYKVKILRIVAPERNLAKLKQEAEDYSKIASHISEVALDDYSLDNYNYVIYNDPNDDAITKIRDITISETIESFYEHVIFIDLDDTICQCNDIYNQTITEAGEYLADQMLKYVQNFTKHDIVRRYETEVFIVIKGFERRIFKRPQFALDLVTAASKIWPNVSEHILSEIYNIGNSVYSKKFRRLPNTDKLESVTKSGKYKIVIFTVGQRPDQMRKLYDLGLQDYECESFIHKDYTIFNVLMNKYPAYMYSMIGDSLDRDILPAAKAEINNIYHITSKPKHMNIDCSIYRESHPNINKIMENVKAVPSLNCALEHLTTQS